MYLHTLKHILINIEINASETWKVIFYRYLLEERQAFV